MVYRDAVGPDEIGKMGNLLVSLRVMHLFLYPRGRVWGIVRRFAVLVAVYPRSISKTGNFR